MNMFGVTGTELGLWAIIHEQRAELQQLREELREAKRQLAERQTRD
jgi:hypothetical protein